MMVYVGKAALTASSCCYHLLRHGRTKGWNLWLLCSNPASENHDGEDREQPRSGCCSACPCRNELKMHSPHECDSMLIFGAKSITKVTASTTVETVRGEKSLGSSGCNSGSESQHGYEFRDRKGGN